MHALIAFDKFKDSLTASAACTITAQVLRENIAQSPLTVDLCPLADGGEGFAAILTERAQGDFKNFTVEGPRQKAVAASIGFVALAALPDSARARLALPDGLDADASIAIIEMASASGLALLPQEQRDPWQAGTRGTGQLMRHAAGLGVAAILLGVGGSATNDLGLGALHALGFTFHDATGEALDPLPAQWSRIVEIRGQATALPPIRIACDVSNPLLGLRGAASVYGPQKGLLAADLLQLETESARLAALLCAHCAQPASLIEQPGAGAAGGIAFGLMTAAGAKLLPGFELIADWLDLETRLARADLVITGEGRFDETSLQGKGPGAVASRALALGKTVHVFAGQIRPPENIPAHLHLHTITPAGMPLPEALSATPVLLASAVRKVAPRL